MTTPVKSGSQKPDSRNPFSLFRGSWPCVVRYGCCTFFSISPQQHSIVNFTAVREIKLLREFKHENIIELVDCFTTPDQAVCLVYEVAFTDLEKILANKSISLSLADIKQHLFTLLTAISECHDRWILHRDLKPGTYAALVRFSDVVDLPCPPGALCSHIGDCSLV